MDRNANSVCFTPPRGVEHEAAALDGQEQKMVAS